MPEKENQRVRLTRQMLKNSLIELMRAKPIGKITVKELCENADINRSTFYLYYTDPYALLKEIEEELLSQARGHLQKMDSHSDSVQYLRALLVYIKDNAHLFETLLCNQENISFEASFTEVSFKNLKYNLMLNCPERVVAYVYGYLIMGSLDVIKRWIVSGFELPCEELADLIFRLSDRAVADFSGHG